MTFRKIFEECKETCKEKYEEFKEKRKRNKKRKTEYFKAKRAKHRSLTLPRISLKPKKKNEDMVFSIATDSNGTDGSDLTESSSDLNKKPSSSPSEILAQVPISARTARNLIYENNNDHEKDPSWVVDENEEEDKRKWEEKQKELVAMKHDQLSRSVSGGESGDRTPDSASLIKVGKRHSASFFTDTTEESAEDQQITPGNKTNLSL